MAIFLAELKTFSRSRGESAVAAAAYRAGIDLTDERVGLVRRFSHRTGVLAAYPLMPAGVPAWANDLGQLWNAVERAESRINSRVARELIVSLPVELPEPARFALAHQVGQAIVDRYQVGVLVAVHAPDKRGDQRNFHAHLLITTRVLGPSGFGTKVRCLDDRKQGPDEVHALRQLVEQLTNAQLEAAGVGERVDRRTLVEQAKAAEAQGDFDKAARLTRAPTKHVGRSGTAASRRGEVCERRSANAVIQSEHLQDLAAYMARAHREHRVMKEGTDGAPVIRRHVPSGVARHAQGRVRVGRSTGADAKLLNAQVATCEISDRATKKALREYLDGLLKSLRTPQEVLDAYLAFTGNNHEQSTWQSRCAADPQLVSLMRQSIDARRQHRAWQAKVRDERRRFTHAQALRQQTQKECDSSEASPAAWRIVERRKWKARRMAQASRLRKAVLAEQAARASRTRASDAANEESVLREGIRQAEAAIATRLATGVDTHAGRLPVNAPQRGVSPLGQRLH